MRRATGKPIDTQIQPSDKEVEVVDEGASPALFVLDESGKVLESIARSHDLVALIKVQDISGALTDDRTWIRSTVTAEILELWKAGSKTNGPYRVGSQLVFPWEGGETSIAGKKVKARIPWVRDVQAQNTYLIFGWYPDGNLRVSPQTVYQAVGQRIRSITTGSRGLDDIEHDTLDNVRRRVTVAIANQ